VRRQRYRTARLSLVFLGYSIGVSDTVAKNASSLARSAAEVKPAHAGAQYISLANTVALKTSLIQGDPKK